MDTAVYIAAGAVALAVLSVAVLYNGLVRARNTVDESWSGIDVQLKRRHDLVGNLIHTVAAYAEHERAVLQAATDARTRAVEAIGPAVAARAEAELDAPVGALLAVAEAYPDLKAAENFLDLQRQLAELENQIAASRRIYNGNTRHYNDRIQSFPGLLVARPFGFTSRLFFEVDPAHAGVPRVDAP